jgi:hypothetical protein
MRYRPQIEQLEEVCPPSSLSPSQAGMVTPTAPNEILDNQARCPCWNGASASLAGIPASEGCVSSRIT